MDTVRICPSRRAGPSPVRAGEDFTHATPDTVVEEGDLIIVSGPQDKVERFSELT